MKKMVMATVFVLCSIISCSKKDDQALVTRSIKFESESVSIHVGESVTVAIQHYPENESTPSYKWSSSNEGVAKVNAGKVLAISIGETFVYARANSLEAKVKVIVLPVQPTSLEILLDKHQMLLGESQNIEFRIKPDNTTSSEDFDIVWSSSDENIAKILDGKVVSVGIGLVDIVGKIKGTNIEGKLQIEVLPVKPKSLAIILDKEEMFVGEKQKIDYKIEFNNATHVEKLEIEWKSSDERVVKVISGEIIAIGAGRAEIIAKIKDTEIASTVTITVLSVPITSISFKKTPKTLSIGETFILEPVITPDNATNKEIIWSSSNNNIVSVKNGLITAVSNGEAQILAKSLHGGITSSVQAIVKQPVTKVSLESNTITMEIGEKRKIMVRVYPENAANKNIIWRIPDLIPAAELLEGGVIRAAKKGSFVLQAISADNQQILDNCAINILDIEDLTEVKVVSSEITTDEKNYSSGKITIEITNKSKLNPITVRDMTVKESSGPTSFRIDGVSLGPGQKGILTVSYTKIHSPTVSVNFYNHSYGYSKYYNKSFNIQR